MEKLQQYFAVAMVTVSPWQPQELKNCTALIDPCTKYGYHVPSNRGFKAVCCCCHCYSVSLATIYTKKQYYSNRPTYQIWTSCTIKIEKLQQYVAVVMVTMSPWQPQIPRNYTTLMKPCTKYGHPAPLNREVITVCCCCHGNNVSLVTTNSKKLYYPNKPMYQIWTSCSFKYNHMLLLPW